MNTIFIVLPILTLLMFDLGLTLRPQDFRLIAQRPKPVIIGLVGQIILLPLIAWGIIQLLSTFDFHLSTLFIIGIMLVACSPGGSSSNVFSMLAKGEVALSVTLTACSSLITLFTLPLIMAWVMRSVQMSDVSIQLPIGNLLMQNIVLMVVPVLIGFLVNLFREQAAARIHNVLRRIAMPALVLLVTIFFVQHKQTIIAEFPSLGLTMTTLILATTGCGALLAWLLRLTTRERRTLVIEIGMQNAAQAITIACSPLIFNNEIIAIPAIIYALMMNLILLAYVGMIKIEQFIRTKWQFFRAWQENPIRYRMDEQEHVCHNCGHRFVGNYCPVCSQSSRHGRITWPAIWQGIGQLWGIESRSALFTLWQLLWRPGYLVRDFISGKRQISYPPVKLLVILAALFALVHYFFPVPDPAPSDTGVHYIDFAFDWMNRHQNIGELLGRCFFILPTWLLFRKAPGYPNHTIPEGFFLQVYIAILAYIIQAPFANPNLFTILMTAVYGYATYKQLFGYGYWQTLWRWIVCTVLSIAALLMVVIATVIVDQIGI